VESRNQIGSLSFDVGSSDNTAIKSLAKIFYGLYKKYTSGHSDFLRVKVVWEDFD